MRRPLDLQLRQLVLNEPKQVSQVGWQVMDTQSPLPFMLNPLLQVHSPLAFLKALDLHWMQLLLSEPEQVRQLLWHRSQLPVRAFR